MKGSFGMFKEGFGRRDEVVLWMRRGKGVGVCSQNLGSFCRFKN